MNKTLIRVPLKELRTNDVEVLGSEYPVDGKVFRWNKNSGTTQLVAAASCLVVVTSVEAGMKKRVISPDGAGPSTGVIHVPGGSPVTGIGPSGSDTGDHGWVQVKGPKRVTMMVTMTTPATSNGVGARAVSTTSLPSTMPFGEPYNPTANSANTANLYAKGVVIMSPIAETTAATAVSAAVELNCM